VNSERHPRLAWVVNHIPDLWLFGVVTPLGIYLVFFSVLS
jgi:hypothetical protein